MGKKLLFILGNGFTIDLLKHINNDKNIDVRNLFKYGSCVRWPADNVPGFLSFKHCPNLWNLGARPQMSEQETMSLIEDIITCVNVHASAPKVKATSIGSTASPNDIYLFAYKELSIYLRYLFIAYDNAVKIDFKNVSDWPWHIIANEANNDPNIDKIWIVTYNYDIWLERGDSWGHIFRCHYFLDKGLNSCRITLWPGPFEWFIQTLFTMSSPGETKGEISSLMTKITSSFLKPLKGWWNGFN